LRGTHKSHSSIIINVIISFTPSSITQGTYTLHTTHTHHTYITHTSHTSQQKSSTAPWHQHHQASPGTNWREAPCTPPPPPGPAPQVNDGKDGRWILADCCCSLGPLRNLFLLNQPRCHCAIQCPSDI
jgi:hypothetical protein